MPKSLTQIFEERDAANSAIREQLTPLWSLIQEELGVSDDLQTDQPPTFIERQDGSLVFEMPVRAESRLRRLGRGRHSFSIPITAVEACQDDIRTALRRAYPLMCPNCGIHHPTQTRVCGFDLGCYGSLVWRSNAPSPSYYIESHGRHGYYEPGPRSLRYAIDLKDNTIFGVQITLRRQECWREPIDSTLANIIHVIEATVGVDLAKARLGEATRYANAACFSFDPPDWCRTDAHRLALRVAVPRRRLISA